MSWLHLSYSHLGRLLCPVIMRSNHNTATGPGGRTVGSHDRPTVQIKTSRQRLNWARRETKSLSRGTIAMLEWSTHFLGKRPDWKRRWKTYALLNMIFSFYTWNHPKDIARFRLFWRGVYIIYFTRYEELKKSIRWFGNVSLANLNSTKFRY